MYLARYYRRIGGRDGGFVGAYLLVTGYFLITRYDSGKAQCENRKIGTRVIPFHYEICPVRVYERVCSHCSVSKFDFQK